MYEVYVIESAEYWYVGSTVCGADRRFAQHVKGQGGAPLIRAQLDLNPTLFTHKVVEFGIGDRLWQNGIGMTYICSKTLVRLLTLEDPARIRLTFTGTRTD